MTPRQKQLMALGTLVFVMVAVYARAFAPRRPTPRANALPAALEVSVVTPEALNAPDLQEIASRREAQRERAAELGWNRDPFVRGRGAGPMGGFTLSGILWDTQQPIAIINGEMLHVGQALDGYRVAEIAQDRVSLTDGTHTYQLLIAP